MSWTPIKTVLHWWPDKTPDCCRDRLHPGWMLFSSLLRFLQQKPWNADPPDHNPPTDALSETAHAYIHVGASILIRIFQGCPDWSCSFAFPTRLREIWCLSPQMINAPTCSLADGQLCRCTKARRPPGKKWAFHTNRDI